MHKLIVEWTNEQGTKKQWKLAPTDSPVSIGTSKYSEIMFNHPNLKGMHGLLEYKNEKWWYLDFSANSTRANQEINEGSDLDIGNIQLAIHLQAKPKIDFTHLGFSGGQQFQLFLVKHNGETIQTEILKPGKSFTWQGPAGKTEVSPQPGDWHVTKAGDFEVHQKSITVESPEFLKHWKEPKSQDNDSKLFMGMVGGTALLIALMVALSPNKGADMGLQAQIDQMQVTREVSMVVPKKKKKEMAAPQQTNSPAAASKEVSNSAPASGAKKLIASFDRSRISKLLGKISAAPAKSKNVVIGNGIAAGSAASGRALAAIGNVDQGGKDWSGDSKNSGITISTFGKGGGNAGGLGTYGKLNGNGVGSSGVGLIEEDGEVTGGLDREVIAQYIKSQLGQILYCYERQLSANPNLFGKVAVRFTIGGTGAVETQKIGESTLKSAQVESCILQKVSNWKFPTPKGGTQVMVTYPFLFKSTN